MNTRLHRWLLLGMLIALLAAPAHAQDAARVVSYQPSAEYFPNPERGFYIQRAPLWLDGERIPITADELRGARDQGISLIRAYYLFEAYREQPLAQSVLDALADDFATLRAVGFKMIPRFSYNFPTNDDYEQSRDAPLEWVLRHIEQLEPLLRANADVIAFMDTGFVGAWGEWHSSSNELVGADGRPNDASRAIIERLLAALPPERMIALRYPLLKQELVGDSEALNGETAHSQTMRARIGAHDDCFLASDTNWGTYIDADGEPQIEFFKDYLSADNRYVVQSGETCNTAEDAQPYIGCENALADLERLRWSSLNIDYHPDVLDGWREEGCFPEIERRLGYRLRLIEGEYPTEGQAGDSISVRLRLVNEGFAAPYNPRDVALLLRAADGTLYPLPLAQMPDPRFWLPDAGEIDVMFDAALPADLPPGEYALLLRLADPLPSVAADPAYSIRLATADVWEVDTGFNNLLIALTVR
jgi:hypothetical protein